MSKIRSVCVYCGSSPGSDTQYLGAAKALGSALAANGIRLIFGGGTKGLMGAVSRSVMQGGGQVTGIIPQFLMDKEATADALTELDELIVTEDMHSRKHTMFERSDAFVTLPGGIGTLEEVIEIMTWAQLGRHEKPIVLANVGGFWDPLTSLLDHMSEAGFIHTAHRVRPLIIDDPDKIVPSILQAGAMSEGDRAVIERL